MEQSDERTREIAKLICETLTLNGVTPADGIAAMASIILSQFLSINRAPEDMQEFLLSLYKQYEESWMNYNQQ